MKVVLQRCSSARVVVDEETVGQIAQGWAAFVGVEQHDDETCARWLAQKIVDLRMFDDADGRFNLSLRDVNGSVLLVSNFTLCAKMGKGTRPSFSNAAKPEHARELLEAFATLLQSAGANVQTGVFGAQMKVEVANDGPVTLWLERSSHGSSAALSDSLSTESQVS